MAELQHADLPGVQVQRQHEKKSRIRNLSIWIFDDTKNHYSLIISFVFRIVLFEIHIDIYECFEMMSGICFTFIWWWGADGRYWLWVANCWSQVLSSWEAIMFFCVRACVCARAQNLHLQTPDLWIADRAGIMMCYTVQSLQDFWEDGSSSVLQDKKKNDDQCSVAALSVLLLVCRITMH